MASFFLLSNNYRAEKHALFASLFLTSYYNSSASHCFLIMLHNLFILYMHTFINQGDHHLKRSYRYLQNRRRIFNSVITYIYLFIQVIFLNIISYLYRTFKEGKNYINYIYQIGINFNLFYQVSDFQTTLKNTNRHHA